jgi:hypothetical protein
VGMWTTLTLIGQLLWGVGSHDFVTLVLMLVACGDNNLIGSIQNHSKIRILVQASRTLATKSTNIADTLKTIQLQLEYAKMKYNLREEETEKSLADWQQFESIKAHSYTSPIDYIGDLRNLRNRIPQKELLHMTGVELVLLLKTHFSTDYSGKEILIYQANQEITTAQQNIIDQCNQAEVKHSNNVKTLIEEFETLKSVIKSSTEQGAKIAPQTLKKRERKVKKFKKLLSVSMKTRSKDSKTRNNTTY